jgi:hypothetical protein
MYILYLAHAEKKSDKKLFRSEQITGKIHLTERIPPLDSHPVIRCRVGAIPIRHWSFMQKISFQAPQTTQKQQKNASYNKKARKT